MSGKCSRAFVSVLVVNRHLSVNLTLVVPFLTYSLNWFFALAQLFLYSCWIVRGSSQQPLDCWLWVTAAIRALSPRESCLYSRGCRPPPAGKWSRLCPQAGGAVVWNAGHPDPRTLLVRGKTSWTKGLTEHLWSTNQMQTVCYCLLHQQVN